MKHIMGPDSRSNLTNVQEGDIQPNAVDLRLDKVFFIRPNAFTLSEDEKYHRGSIELNPKNGWWTLQPGTYEVVFENNILVGDSEAGWVITRSTLIRNGCFLVSGLYDSGYHGVMAGQLNVQIAPLRIKQGTRIGQYLSFNSEALHSYEGSYGFGKEHDAKYGSTENVKDNEYTDDQVEAMNAAEANTFFLTDEQAEAVLTDQAMEAAAQFVAQAKQELKEAVAEEIVKRRPGRPKKIKES